MNIIFCGYRSWALNIIDSIKGHERIASFEVITSKVDFDIRIKGVIEEGTIILFLGWSWIVEDDVVKRYLCLGLHPSDLPHYRGGSPIQHQIINGISETKLSLMTLSSKLDGGEVWLKEDLNLNGNNIKVIFKNLESSAITLLNNFFTTYNSLVPVKQNLANGSYYARRTPVDSKISIEDFSKVSLKDIYNKIRCLTDPYPNAYIEDGMGNRLLFKEVEFVENGIQHRNR